MLIIGGISMSKKYLIISFIFILLFSALLVQAQENSMDLYFQIYDKDAVYIYGLDSCSHCQDAKKFLEDLKNKYGLKYYYIEVSSPTNQQEYYMQLERFNTYSQTVPLIVFANEYWIGFDSNIKNNIEKTLGRYGLIEVEAKKDDELNKDNNKQIDNQINTEQKVVEDDNFLAENNIKKMSPFFSTIIIGFIDGFNPCSLWVLTILLGFLVHYRSRKKMIIIGSVFLITTALVYGMFITGVLNAFNLFEYINGFNLILGLFILIFSLINLKDYFYFKKGISATISDKNKNLLINKMRKLVTDKNSLFISSIFTVLIALLAALVELPCTSGFPVIWSNIMSERGLTANPSVYIPLILLYLLVYLFDEIIIFIIASVKLRVKKMKLETGKNLKLIIGFIMFWISLDIIFKTHFSNSLRGLLGILAFSVISYFSTKKYLESKEKVGNGRN